MTAYLIIFLLCQQLSQQYSLNHLMDPLRNCYGKNVPTFEEAQENAQTLNWSSVEYGIKIIFQVNANYHVGIR